MFSFSSSKKAEGRFIVGGRIGFGNHEPKTKAFTADNLIHDYGTTHPHHDTKDSLLKMVLEPALAGAGFKNPKAKASEWFKHLLEEGKIIKHG